MIRSRKDGSSKGRREGALSSLLCVIGRRSGATEEEEEEGEEEEEEEVAEPVLAVQDDVSEAFCSRSVSTFLGKDNSDVELLVNDDDSVMSTMIDAENTTLPWLLKVKNADAAVPVNKSVVEERETSRSKTVANTCTKFPTRKPISEKTLSSTFDDFVKELEETNASESNCSEVAGVGVRLLGPGVDVFVPAARREDSDPTTTTPSISETDLSLKVETPTRVATTTSTSMMPTTVAVPLASRGVTWTKTILKQSSTDRDTKNNRVVTWRLPSYQSVRTNSSSRLSSEFNSSWSSGYELVDEWEDARMQAAFYDCHALLCDDYM